MELALSDDQVQILDAIDTLAKPYASVPIHDISFALTSAELTRELAEGGFLDVAAMEELGPETAALVVERLARLPFAVEAAASALVRPLLDSERPRGPLSCAGGHRRHGRIRRRAQLCGDGRSCG